MVNRFTIGPWALDPELNIATREGRIVRLEPKAMEVCVCLADNAGKLVRKEELIRAVWQDTFVTDDVLVHAVSELRRLFEDNPKDPKFIETIQKKGYRLIAPVEYESIGPLAPSARPEPDGLKLIDAGPIAKELAHGGMPSNGATDSLTAGRSWKRFVLLAALAPLLLGFAGYSLGSRVFSSKRTRRDQPPAKPFTRRFAFALDYTRNAVLAYSVNETTGTLESVFPSPFKSGEHPTGAVLTPYRDILYVANRGRGDGICGNGCNISAFAVDQVSGGLTELELSPYPAGSGPVAIAIHPSEKYIYVANVISNDVYVYERTAQGDLRLLGPPVPVGTHPFFLSLSPSARFLYVANQDDATISGFTLGNGQELKPIPGSPFATGLRPRSITIDPSGNFAYVVNYGVNPYSTRADSCVGKYKNGKGRGCNISVFRIDQETGALVEIKDSPFESDGINPLASVMDARGRYLYVANINSNDVSAYEVNPTTGALRTVEGSPFPGGKGPNSIALDWSGEYLYVVNGFSRDITQFEIIAGGGLREIGKPAAAGVGPISIVSYYGPTD